MIARYAWLYKEELDLSSPKEQNIQELGRLLSFSDQLVRDRTGKMSSLKEMQTLLNSPSTDTCCKIITKTIHYLTKQIAALEQRIKKLIKRDESLQRNYKLLNTYKESCVFVCEDFPKENQKLANKATTKRLN